MLYEEEKDYIMRIIKEMICVLISVLLGKRYVQVELSAGKLGCFFIKMCYTILLKGNLRIAYG